ncbi:MAG: V-type ATP synthase subunit D, partial [Candidatus Omnitrophica bacterium]|nr:V-type ATP synthase subunit D [Candidatus Omnitrophota bacterium]
KSKLTKGELKRQRDALKQYERYLPTLQLKKQPVQIEISRQNALLEEKLNNEQNKRKAVESWAGLFADQKINIGALVKLTNTVKGLRNIAGVELPVFIRAEFTISEYDLFLTPPWVDSAVESVKMLVWLREETAVVREGLRILKQELRTTSQRVNLFEKVKIPAAEEAIRLIKIYIGDQMASAVGHSKMAKRKIEEVELEGAVL